VGATTAVAADVAVLDPPSFVAVTTTRSAEPTSAEVRPYVKAVAPAMSTQLEPVESQRRHCAAYEIGADPVQEPVVAVMDLPSSSVPDTVGGAVFVAEEGADVTTDVGIETAVALPTEFDASTASLIVDPTSAADTAYVEPVAPPMSAQDAPAVSQRRHRYAYEIGVVPDHVPTSPVSVLPSCGVPAIDGAAVFAGGEGAAVTVAVAADVAVAWPPAFVAVTATTIVEPTSAATTP
jgi:hypothetical protein